MNSIYHTSLILKIVVCIATIANSVATSKNDIDIEGSSCCSKIDISFKGPWQPNHKHYSGTFHMISSRPLLYKNNKLQLYITKDVFGTWVISTFNDGSIPILRSTNCNENGNFCLNKCKWKKWDDESGSWQIDEKMQFSCVEANSQGVDNLMVGDQPPEERLNSKDDKNGFCVEGQYACKNLYCIPQQWVCDGQNDCEDFSDELNCNGGSLTDIMVADEPFDEINTIRENEISEEDECCQVLEMSSDGIATKIHSNKLGLYHALETLHSDRIYHQQGSNKFLHRSSIGFWTVSNETGTNDGYIYHPTCKQRCPEACEIGWRTFEDPKEPWKIDPQLNLKCGRDILLRI